MRRQVVSSMYNITNLLGQSCVKWREQLRYPAIRMCMEVQTLENRNEVDCRLGLREYRVLSVANLKPVNKAKTQNDNIQVIFMSLLNKHVTTNLLIIN